MSGRGKGGKAKGGKSKTRSSRAGLQFPVGRIHRLLRKGSYADRVGAGAPVYLAAVLADEDTLVPRNFARGTITYPDGTKGELLYVKAAVSRTTPLAIQRYAAGDRTFPNYSTANQMLTDAQLTNLVKLGFSSMNTALQVRAEDIEREAAEADA